MILFAAALVALIPTALTLMAWWAIDLLFGTQSLTEDRALAVVLFWQVLCQLFWMATIFYEEFIRR